jgi:polysaccharide pyruvyl transferase WcaK-like protein
MRVRLFNVKFSPNLGDGLLSECLEEALRRLGADGAGTFSVDLGARTRYARGSSNRGRLLSLLQATPPALRSSAMSILLQALAKTKWEPHYRNWLADTDAVVVGGGNLFTDMDLNFPVKITSSLKIAAAKRKPVAIYGVGVSGDWSAAGTSMVREAIARSDLRYVSVRDEASKSHFDRLFASAAGREAIVVRDPGLMISRFVEARLAPSEEKPIGLCITSAIALNYHSAIGTTDDELALWYRNLCERLIGSGSKVVAFTNGSPEDDQFLEKITPMLLSVPAEKLSIAKVYTPKQLAGLIGGFGFLVAHRMHALIAAFSFGVKIYALEWDAKVNAFMNSVHLSNRITPATGDTFEAVAQAAIGSLGQKLVHHHTVVEEAYTDVGGMLDALMGRRF